MAFRLSVLLGLGLLTTLISASAAVAQQRPLVTEDPEPVGSGLILVEVGIDYLREQPYPVSGLRGHLVRVPTLGFSMGVSAIAEIQVDNISYQRLRVLERVDAPLSQLLRLSGDRTSDMDDIVVGAKVRMLSETEGRPAIGLRFATRLPNTGNESGLGARYDGFSEYGPDRQDDPVGARGGQLRLWHPERPRGRQPAERRDPVRRVDRERRHPGVRGGRRGQRTGQRAQR